MTGLALEAVDHLQLALPPALVARGACWFVAGAVELHLGVERSFRPARKAHPGIRVTGLDVLAERLTERGGPFTWDDSIPSHRRFHTEDPFGNRLEFLAGA